MQLAVPDPQSIPNVRKDLNLEPVDPLMASFGQDGASARPLKREVQELLENLLSEAMLAGRISIADPVDAKADGGKPIFTATRS